jgi:hypothetical protein
MWFCSDECAFQYALEPAGNKGGKPAQKKTAAGTR